LVVFVIAPAPACVVGASSRVKTNPGFQPPIEHDDDDVDAARTAAIARETVARVPRTNAIDVDDMARAFALVVPSRARVSVMNCLFSVLNQSAVGATRATRAQNLSESA
jgi:hypothetical protein